MDYTKQELKTILRALKKLRNIKNIKARGCGICFNLHMILDHEIDTYDFVAETSKGWPHHTGKYSYPVKKCPHNAKWSPNSIEGALRLDLLEYLISEVEKQLKELKP